MLSNKSSRSPSLSSLNNFDDLNMARVLEPQMGMPSENNIEASNRIDSSYQFTLEHPIGAILLKLAQDNTALARRSNIKGMETNINELCSSFQNGINMERAEFNSKIDQTSANIENSIIYKELNSHKINCSVNPPENFSPVPTLINPQKIAECLKIFPRNVKFSGSKQDNNMSVVEFLNSLKFAQEQCQLSEAEFIDRMLAASTGLAHELMLEWKTNGESIATIYHNLLINFDKRLSADEAKLQLSMYKTPKSSTLAKAESQIMILAGRTASALPEGPSRTAYYNLEGCNALIRALPQYSSTIVNNLYNQVSARLGRACTLAELSRGLNLYRVSIDKDIKQNGSDGIFKSRRTITNGGKNIGAPKARFATYNITSSGFRGISEPHRQHLNPNTANRSYSTSYTPKPTPRNFQNGATKSTPWMNRNKFQGRNNNPRGARGNQNSQGRGSFNAGCSLCGIKAHNTKECRNMQGDDGKRIDMIPTYGVCSKCPKYISPRLHHPEVLCPYRAGGPLNNRGNNRNI